MKTFLCSLFALLTVGAVAAEPGLAGHWPMNDGEGVAIKDVGPNGRNGAIQAPETTSWVAGRSGGKALEFKGVNGKAPYVMADIKGIDLTKGMTVMTWIKLGPEYQRNSIFEIAANCRGSFGKGFRLMIHHQRVVFSVGDGEKNMFCANSTYGKHPLEAGTWFHVAATHDGDKTMKVYIDGELAGASDEKNSRAMEPGIGILAIGSQFNYSPFQGIISDFRLYNKALTDAEILTAAQAE